jgi:hypothetical protein
MRHRTISFGRPMADFPWIFAWRSLAMKTGGEFSHQRTILRKQFPCSTGKIQGKFADLGFSGLLFAAASIGFHWSFWSNSLRSRTGNFTNGTGNPEPETGSLLEDQGSVLSLSFRDGQIATRGPRSPPLFSSCGRSNRWIKVAGERPESRQYPPDEGMRRSRLPSAGSVRSAGLRLWRFAHADDGRRFVRYGLGRTAGAPRRAAQSFGCLSRDGLDRSWRSKATAHPAIRA